MRSDFIELARICISHSRVTASLEVAAELRRIAKEYRKKAADLEWENWPADGEENAGNVLQEGYGRSAATCNQIRLHHGQSSLSSKFYFQIQPISVCTDLRGS
jgi:hypothetical protein